MRAMDESIPLSGLSELGLVANPDGSYSVDLRRFPQWAPLDARLFVLSNPEVLETFVPALKARGFRDEDVHIVRTYVATHDPRQATLAEGKPLLDSYARHLQSRRQAGQSLDIEELIALRYQKTRIRGEAERAWAVGLLDVLDNQRQRILASFFEELNSVQSFGAPARPLGEQLTQEVQPLLSGEYVQLLALELADLQRDMEERAAKLKELQR
jgi:hypothetical protein